MGCKIPRGSVDRLSGLEYDTAVELFRSLSRGRNSCRGCNGTGEEVCDRHRNRLGAQERESTTKNHCVDRQVTIRLTLAWLITYSARSTAIELWKFSPRSSVVSGATNGTSTPYDGAMNDAQDRPRRQGQKSRESPTANCCCRLPFSFSFLPGGRRAPDAWSCPRSVSALMLSAKERSQKPSGVSAGRPFASVYLCLVAWCGVV